MQTWISRITLIGVLTLCTGCSILSGTKNLVEMHRVAEEEITSERYRPLFVAGVEQAEWSLDRGDPETAGNILNGLSYLAYETRDEISAEGAMSTILTVHDLNQRGILKGALAGSIIPVPRDHYDCSITTGNCDTPDSSRICYELFSMPDTLDIGCIAIDKQ
jgi:hypothetical protein